MAAPFPFNDEVYRLIYPGWGRAEAESDWREQGEGKWANYQRASAPKSAEQIAKEQAEAMVAAAQRQIDEETKFLKETFQDNPFAFDEALAKQSAHAEYSPYYSELLEDYLADIEGRRDTIQGDKKLVQDLFALDTTKRTRSYEKAVGSAEQGYAGSGLFFSGMKARKLGEEEVEFKTEEQKSQDLLSTNIKGYEKQLGDIETDKERKRRDVTREQEAAVEGGVLQRKTEQEKAYYEPRLASYYRKYPTGSNLLQGYVPENYLRY